VSALVFVLGTPPVLDLIAARASDGSDLLELCQAENDDESAVRGERLVRLGLLPRASSTRWTTAGDKATRRLRALLVGGAALYRRPASESPDGGGGVGLEVNVS
jgi:hypothetical protein